MSVAARENVNEDGAIDLLVADSGSDTISLLLGTGRGVRLTRRSFCEPTVASTAAADLLS
jgi:hypothetical protein